MGKTCSEEVDEVLGALGDKDPQARIRLLEDVARMLASRIDRVEARIRPFRGLRD